MREIRSLTGIRGTACCFIMFYHYADRRIGDGFVKTFIDHGYLTLDMFFILSGFVMALTYGGMFAEGISRTAYGKFFGRRIARIYPIYLVVTLALTAIILAGFSSDYLSRTHLVAILIPNLLLMQTWVGQISIDFPAWSVSAEWAAYAVFPWLLLLTLKSSRLVATAAGIAGMVALAVIAVLPGWTVMHPERHGMLNIFYGFGPPLIRCFAEFVFGLLAFRVVSTSFGNTLSRTSWPGVVIGAAITVLFSIRYSDVLVVPVFVLFIVAISADRGLGARILGSRIPYKLGEWSYSIYLIHPHASRISIMVERMARARHLPHPILISLVPAMAATIIAAAIAYQTIEKPGRRLIQRLISRPKHVTLPARA